jgi:trehalose synthase
MLETVKTLDLDLEPYREFIDEKNLIELDRLKSRLSGLRVGHLNSTAVGGGVAEILRSLVPMMKGLGIRAEWYTIGAGEDFFPVTKNIHNSLQGGNWQFDSRAHEIFLFQNRRVAEEMRELDVDVWVVHDPQPCPISRRLRGFHQTIWHCHIDTSTPNRAVWNYLYRFLKDYDRLVFCLPEYINGNVPKEKLSFLRPAIDPLTVKNQALPMAKAKEILGRLAIDPERRLVSQLARFDPWKDPEGVIDAYRLAKESISGLQLALVGVMAAQDDPEAVEVLERVLRYAGDDPDIHIYSDPKQVADLEVNAFQTASDVVVQKSLREGFGLSVAEAMWKGHPVIGGNCGGIRVQIDDGQNGYLVNSPAECAKRIVGLIQDEPMRKRMGANGRESVRRRYLMPRLVQEYLALIEEVVLGV